jgi:hypothetical protein
MPYGLCDSRYVLVQREMETGRSLLASISISRAQFGRHCLIWSRASLAAEPALVSKEIRSAGNRDSYLIDAGKTRLAREEMIQMSRRPCGGFGQFGKRCATRQE